MRFLISIIGCGFLASCADKAEVVNDGLVRSSAVDFGGANIRSAVLPMNGKGGVARDKIVYKAQTAELDGPFKWTIEASGDAETLEWMVVHDVKIETKRSKRSESYSKSLLGKKVFFELPPVVVEKKSIFKKLKKDEEDKKLEKPEAEKETPKVFAKYALPGLLQVFPKADGVVSVVAHIEVKGSRGVSRDWVKFTMAPGAKKSRPFRFLPTVVEVGGAPVHVPEIPNAVIESGFNVQPVLSNPQFPLPVQ